MRVAPPGRPEGGPRAGGLRLDSPRNPAVVEALRRVEDGEAVPVDGARMLTEALEAQAVVDAVFALPGEYDAGLVAAARAAGAAVHEVSPRVLEKLSSLPSPRGVFALARVPARPLSALGLPVRGLALLLDGVQDPANVGAMLRSAEAFGASAALLLDGCASPFSAKALRASAGSALRLPIAYRLTAAAALAWVRERGATLLGADAHGGADPLAIALSSAAVVAIGAEGQGLSAEVAAALDRRVTIPLGGRVESLNAAVAAGVLLYALGPRAAPGAVSPKTSASNR